MDDVKFALCYTASNHSQRFGRSVRDVNNSTGDVRTAVIDPNRHRPPTSDVCYAQPSAKWQRRMGSCQFVRIELLAVCGLCSFCVEPGNSTRHHLSPGCFFVRCEGSMLF